MGNENDDMSPIAWMGIILFVLFVILFFVKKPEYDRKEKEKEIQRMEKFRKWSEDMQEHNIKSITIFMDVKESHRTNSRYGLWQRVKSIYVNKKRINIDSLYRKEDFVFKHCNNKYYRLTASWIDMVRYEFGLENKMIERSFGVEGGSSYFFYSNKFLHPRLKHHLPECWD